MTDRIRLTGRMPGYLAVAASRSDARYRSMGDILVQTYMHSISEQYIWSLLEENSRYSDIVNFSSRPVGNEDEAGYALFGLPPGFSERLLTVYETNGFLTREDVHVAYEFSIQRG